MGTESAEEEVGVGWTHEKVLFYLLYHQILRVYFIFTQPHQPVIFFLNLETQTIAIMWAIIYTTLWYYRYIVDILQIYYSYIIV